MLRSCIANNSALFRPFERYKWGNIEVKNFNFGKNPWFLANEQNPDNYLLTELQFFL